MMEDMIVKELRNKVDESIPKETGNKVKVSRDEAISEGIYVFKRTLLENRPESIEEAKALLENTSKMIFAYFKSLGYDIPPKEFQGQLTKDMPTTMPVPKL